MTVGIVGLGLIGGSIGLALRRPGWTILGIDPDADAGNVALQRQCVDRLASIEDVSQADVVFVAVPPKATITCLKEVFQHKRPDTIVSDCASYKTEIVEFAQEAGEPSFIAGHPMAGHEKTGAAYASAWLFKHANWILSPLDTSDASALQRLEDVVRETGATPVHLDATAHDRQVALLSHLPHVIAAVLVRMGANLQGTEASAGSWKDLTRVGGVDPTLWTQIMMGNRHELGKAMATFEGELNTIRTMLETGDDDGLSTYLKKAQKAKQPAPTVGTAKTAKARRR